MERYIDADAMLGKYGVSDDVADFVEMIEGMTIKEWVECQPTVDVAPVIHAHWIEKEDCSVITDIPWSMCSACGEYSPKLLYCAFCGAKMDKGMSG